MRAAQSEWHCAFLSILPAPDIFLNFELVREWLVYREINNNQPYLVSAKGVESELRA